MRKDDLILKTAQRELERRQWGNFVERDTNGIAIGQGGNGVVVVGCMACDSPQYYSAVHAASLTRRTVNYHRRDFGTNRDRGELNCEKSQITRQKQTSCKSLSGSAPN
jgi:hypothetical protein